MPSFNPYHLAYLVDFVETLRALNQAQDIDYTLILRRISKHEGLPVAISMMERALADAKLLEKLLGSESIDESSSVQLSNKK